MSASARSGGSGSFADRFKDRISVTGRDGGERRLGGSGPASGSPHAVPARPRASVRRDLVVEEVPEDDFDGYGDAGYYEQPAPQPAFARGLGGSGRAEGRHSDGGALIGGEDRPRRTRKRFVPAQQKAKHATEPAAPARAGAGRKLAVHMPGHGSDGVAIYTSPQYAERQQIQRARIKVRGGDASANEIEQHGQDDRGDDDEAFYEDVEEFDEPEEEEEEMPEVFSETSEAAFAEMDRGLGLSGLGGRRVRGGGRAVRGSVGAGAGSIPQQRVGRRSEPIPGGYAAAAEEAEEEFYDEEGVLGEEMVPEDSYYDLDRPRVQGAGASIGVGKRFARKAPSTALNRRWAMFREANEERAQSGDETDRLAYGRKPRNVEYKPYGMDDYRQIRETVPASLGSLGPDLEDPETVEKRKTRERLKQYERVVHERNLATIEMQSARRSQTTRTGRGSHEDEMRRERGEQLRRARDYARTVPKPDTARTLGPQTDRGPRRPTGGSTVRGTARGGGTARGMGDLNRQLDELDLRHREDLARERMIRRQLAQ